MERFYETDSHNRILVWVAYRLEHEYSADLTNRRAIWHAAATPALNYCLKFAWDNMPVKTRLWGIQ